LYFGGFDLGSRCSIKYPQEPDEHNWRIYKIILDECMEELEKGEMTSISTYDKMSRYPDTSKYISGNSQDIANLLSKAKEYLRPNFKIHYDQTIIKID
jgi:predicted Zn-dependent protease with MMP-like domain